MKTTILISAFFLCLMSCTKNDECKDEILNIKNFETEFGCANTRFNLVVNLNNECTVIRSKEAYDSQVSGPCHPEIDFSLYDLVIGKQSTGNYNDTVLFDLRKTCPEKQLRLVIDVLQSAITLPSTVVYHALIPKLADNVNLDIMINIKN